MAEAYSLADISALWAEYEQESRFVALNRRGSVACIICGAQGPGIVGKPREVDAILRRNNPHNWQRLHCREHVWECVCGIHFASSQSLSAHCAQYFRQGVEGHGRLDMAPGSTTIWNVFKLITIRPTSKTYFERWG